MGINALPVGYILKDDYKIIQSLGQGGFGITYLAEDTTLGHKVVIKEFLPQSMAVRDQSRYTVAPYTEGDEVFSHLLTRFEEEAKLLAGLRHPNVVKVTRLIEENDTAYFVMDYEEGETLEDYLEHSPQLTEQDILGIMMPVLEGTKYVHDQGVLHRDIAPDNIYLKVNGMPMLIDFGAARNAVAEQSQKLSAIAKDGYSPPEQYTANNDQNAATDIYALGAVMYRMITGNKPANAAQRQMAKLENQPDPIGNLVENYKGKYSKTLLQAIMKALIISQSNRFQSIQEFQQAILDGTVIEVDKPKKNKLVGIGVSVIAIIGFIVGINFLKPNMLSTETNEDTKHLAVLEAKPIMKKIKKKLSKEDACKSGDYKECTNLGREYYIGKNLKQDFFKAVELFNIACENNNAKGCYNLAIMYHKGQGTRQDYLMAAKLYKKACLQGDARGCSNLGFLYEKGEGVSQDNIKASEFYTKACDGGITEGCSNLGYMYENGYGVDKNMRKAIELYTKVCDSDEAIACYNLGITYENGQGVNVDKVKAVELYAKACDGGITDGCTSLGYMYENGEGIGVDKNKAAELYRKSCNEGDAKGCYYHAVLHYRGIGIARNYEKAIEYYTKACNGDVYEGCDNLGYMYENGEGVSVNKDQAVELYAKACDGGSAGGCCSIGFIYESNNNIPKAKKFFGKACDLGENIGCESFSRLN